MAFRCWCPIYTFIYYPLHLLFCVRSNVYNLAASKLLFNQDAFLNTLSKQHIEISLHPKSIIFHFTDLEKSCGYQYIKLWKTISNISSIQNQVFQVYAKSIMHLKAFKIILHMNDDFLNMFIDVHIQPWNTYNQWNDIYRQT